MAVREATAAEIPRVDVSGLRSHTLSGTPTADGIAAQIRAASLGTGFFFIIGHLDAAGRGDRLLRDSGVGAGGRCRRPLRAGVP